MTLPFDPKIVKTLKDLTKGGVAGIVILAYALLWLDHQELKEDRRQDKKELQEENRRIQAQLASVNSKLFELQSTVIVNNTESNNGVREELQFIKYELKLVNK